MFDNKKVLDLKYDLQVLDSKTTKRDQDLDQQIAKLRQDIISLRNSINARSKQIFKDPDQDETSKSMDGLDVLRSANKNV